MENILVLISLPWYMRCWRFLGYFCRVCRMTGTLTCTSDCRLSLRRCRYQRYIGHWFPLFLVILTCIDWWEETPQLRWNIVSCLIDIGALTDYFFHGRFLDENITLGGPPSNSPRFYPYFILVDSAPATGAERIHHCSTGVRFSKVPKIFLSFS